MPLWPWIVAIVLLAAYLLVRYNLAWIRLIDRTWRNPRHALPRGYERARYVIRDADGGIDMHARWPGWDGWYFFVLPDDRTLPVKMIRGSLMTGLYGLEGIDNYEKLQWRLSTSHALEYLSLVPLDLAGRRTMRYSQQYLPRSTDLRLETDPLYVRVGRDDPEAQGAAAFTRGAVGEIEGTWPNFRMRMADAETGVRVELAYRGEDVLWWADAPGVFTYFAAIGRFEGWLAWERPHDPGGAQPEAVPISGRGSFEHGYARKPFGFDPLFLPVRLLRRVLPGLRPIRYHYELFLDDEALHGGFMKAVGFGIAFRNHGGVFDGAEYAPLTGIRVDYDADSADRVSAGCGGGDTLFYRRWHVRADTPGGALEYTGRRKGPAAQIADGMIYYDFVYEGTFGGRPIAGRGYGEYVHL